ncbi:MAG: DNA mismatch repair endonuclease MutL [Deltaproteobacteria bacterium]|nr:DNA mismatch repair endonuclease MutL [Deltaproteobacteria bacterium]
MAPVRSPIAVLPPALQNQIAAGEVVERPSSVVKELIENSLDAGADIVRVELEGGGRTLIMVQDNGHGMSDEELPLALTRHATSKISDLNGLSHVSSFGFRGEALPSIASVSNCTLTSRTLGTDNAFFVRVVNGKTIGRGPAALAAGTRVEVRDLFSVVPARLNFLKTEATENRRCADIFSRLALAALEVDFELLQSGRQVLHYHKGQCLLERLRILWPPTIVQSLLEVEHRDEKISVNGFCGSPSTAQPRPDRVLFFVNKRPVQDRLLLKSLREAYRGFLLRNEHPQAVLFLKLPPEAVDVNAHPAKAEVRFRDEKSIFSGCYHAVRNALERGANLGSPHVETDHGTPSGPLLPVQIYTTAPPVDHKPGFVGKKFQAFQETAAMFASSRRPADSGLHVRSDEGGSQKQESSGISRPLDLGRESIYLGQVDRTYLIISEPDALLIVDQHAAHERILYHSMRSGPVEKRLLAMPRPLDLHPTELEELDRICPELARAGFDFAREENDRTVLLAVPAWLSPSEASEALRALLIGQSRTLDEMLVSLSCRRAVKAGDLLGPEDAAHLLEQWGKCPDRFHCPHGRPTAIRLGRTELDRLFKRSA